MKKNKSPFETVIGLAIASIAVGYTSKKEALQAITEAKEKVQLDLECLNQGIETIKNLNIKEGSKDE